MSEQALAEPVTKLELVLSCQQDLWLATGPQLHCSGDALSGLEASIAEELQSNPLYRKSLPADVYLRFDMASLPTWLRQYQAHYFNYILRVEARRGQE